MPRGQLKWLLRDLNHRCQVSNHSFAIMDLMMIVDNAADSFLLVSVQTLM